MGTAVELPSCPGTRVGRYDRRRPGRKSLQARTVTGHDRKRSGNLLIRTLRWTRAASVPDGSDRSDLKAPSRDHR